MARRVNGEITEGINLSRSDANIKDSYIQQLTLAYIAWYMYYVALPCFCMLAEVVNKHT